ncbi:MAG: DNA double-strand break repair nuclease NurA [Chloroflexi bacterium]|nr:DNA double-strand break repair nuclease NurA [Chloroflexota bacterium]
MPIDYTQVKPQVEKMGRMIGYKTQELSERAQTAFDQFQTLPDNDTIQARVQLARERDAGYRGAAPLSTVDEPVLGRYACPPAPDLATILASDGSQVYPDIHGAAQYYLTNVAVFSFFHGEDRLPQEFSRPELVYGETLIRDQYDQLVTNATVNARRTVQEMETLAAFAWEHRVAGQPIVALFDGRLLFWLGQEVPDASALERDYRAAMVRLHDTHHWLATEYDQPASLVGYLDRPTSRFVINLLQLLRMEPDQIYRNELLRPGEYEGLDDRWLFRRWLDPGERSAIMVQQSPQNKYYRQFGENYEIAFFYLNVGRSGAPHLARVEIPMWVAHSQRAVETVHALLVAQCHISGAYPYALTRADELAVVRNYDRQMLNMMVQTELIRNQQTPAESGKLIGKYHTRAGRQHFEFGGNG